MAWCFRNDSFPYLWPIKFVRLVASLFFGMFYIAALNIFLVVIECAPYKGHWVQHIWHVRELRPACHPPPTSPAPPPALADLAGGCPSPLRLVPECFAMPHLVHGIVSLCSSITFAVAALLLVRAGACHCVRLKSCQPEHTHLQPATNPCARAAVPCARVRANRHIHTRTHACACWRLS